MAKKKTRYRRFNSTAVLEISLSPLPIYTVQNINTYNYTCLVIGVRTSCHDLSTFYVLRFSSTTCARSMKPTLSEIIMDFHGARDNSSR